MMRAEADATLAVWAELLSDPADHSKYGTAVQALNAAANYYRAEALRLETIVRDDAVQLTQVAQMARETNIGQRPPKTFTVEADAVADAQKRTQCVVLRVGNPPAHWVLTGHDATFWSVPLERYAQGGVLLAGPWRHGTPVELDQAGALARPRAGAT